MDEPRVDTREQLLSQLPEAWDADNLGSLFLKNADVISQFLGCNVDDIMPVLKRFKDEELKSPRELHDERNYRTIQFRENVVANKVEDKKYEYEISPREVVKLLDIARKVVNQGLGIDPGGNLQLRSLLSKGYFGLKYMTFDWYKYAGKDKLCAAFRFPRETGMTESEFQTVLDKVKNGYEKLSESAFA